MTNLHETPTPSGLDFPTRLALMEHKMDKLTHELYGNGQPGSLGRINQRIADLDRRVNDRLDKIESKIGRIVIALVAASTIVGGSAGSVIRAILGGP